MTTSGVTHSKVSSKSDGGDATLVRPTDWNDGHVISYVNPSGLTGATAASRYVGATASGAPVSGTFAVGDFVIDQIGKVWVCTGSGTPGTWVSVLPDPVATLLGAPNTAYEFDTSSLSGLTAIGSPTTENANTTVPSALYYQDSTSTTAWMGRYQASPATPFTVVTKVLDASLYANYNDAAIIVGVSDPTTGALVACCAAWNTNRKINAEKFTNRTTWVSLMGSGDNYPQLPVYLAVVVNSSTSIDCYHSFNGYNWRKFVTAFNPSFTVGSVGLGMKAENSAGFSCSFDYLRIWNSAKTFV